MTSLSPARTGGTTGSGGGSPAERLDERLGDPDAPGTLFSYANCAVLDEREEFPARVCGLLDAMGFARNYVPAALGGDLENYQDTLQLMRVLARRDLTVAIAHGKTYLGAIAAWVGADPAQAAWLAAEVRAGRVVSWALTERDHGSDLLSGEVTAEPYAGGYRLSGEKWLINNATRGQVICVLARTGPERGPRSFGLFLVDKRRLPPGTWHPLPKVPTLGIRGADISGIAFSAAPLPGDALVGAPGAGLEIVLKSLQLTRTMCASLSLGAGDQALRLAGEFTAERRLSNRRLTEFPHTRRMIAEVFADLLLAEAVSIVGSRSVQALTGELSVVSAVTKYLVPTIVDEMITTSRDILGARALLTGVHAHGTFQKLERDHRIVAIFDGSAHVNLASLITQFPAIARAHRDGLADEAGLAEAVTLSGPPRSLDTGRLRLMTRTGCSLLSGLPADFGVAGLPSAVRPLAARLCEISAALHRELAEVRPSADAMPAEAFSLAERYTVCYAGAACLWLWSRNRRWAASSAVSALWSDGRWLDACLRRVLARLGDTPPGGDDVFDGLHEVLVRRRDAGHLPSLLPHRLAGGDVPWEEGR